MDDVGVKVHLDSNGEDLAVEHFQDVEDILEWNKEARTEEQKSDWGRHIARIPNVLLVQWLNEEHDRGNTHLRLFSKEFDQTVIKKKLADPNYAYLRTDKPALITGWMGFGS